MTSRTGVAAGALAVAIAAAALLVRASDDDTTSLATSDASTATTVASSLPALGRLPCASESDQRELIGAASGYETTPRSAEGAVAHYLGQRFPHLNVPAVIDALQLGRRDPTETSGGRTVLEYRVAGETVLHFNVAGVRGRYLVESFSGCTSLTDSPDRPD